MKKGKKFAIALVVMLIPAIGFGFGYFKWNANKDLSNQTLTVKGGIVTTEVSTDGGLVPGDEICGAIGFNIESTAPSLLRVKVEASCNGDNGLKDVGVIEGLKDDWVYGGDDDGYYYYTKAVNKTTQDSVIVQFTDSIKFDAKNGEDVNQYQGKEISTKIEAEMVQAKYGVFETKWDVKSGHPAYDQLKAASDAATPSN